MARPIQLTIVPFTTKHMQFDILIYIYMTYLVFEKFVVFLLGPHY